MRSYIRLLPYQFLLISVVLVFAVQAHALSITPEYGDVNVTRWTGDETSQTDIDDEIANFMGVEYFELYKSNVGDETNPGGSEEGPLLGSYDTVYDKDPLDPSEATITWNPGEPYIDPISYLLVKDGAQEPAWYLFELPYPEWNGMETLYLTGFWPNQGAISHVSLYGSKNERVPEPAAMLLMGMGLVGIAGWTRGRLKKKG